MSMSVTTEDQPVVVYAGVGSLTVANSKTFSTTDQFLTITADDVVLTSSTAIKSGTAPTVINEFTTSRKIGLGATPVPAGIGIATTEFALMTAAGMTLGSGANGE